MDTSKNVTFNVCYLGQVFKDVAETIAHALTELGFTTHFSESQILIDARNIIFGSLR